MTKLNDAPAFFAVVRRAGLLGPTLDQGEVDGIEAILAACGAVGWGPKFAAYALATADHETAGTMRPIREYGSDAYLTRNYDVTGRDPQRARKMGNSAPGDGVRYCGRGYVQLTWKTNYAKMTTALRAAGINVDLVASPKLAMRDDVAAFIMVHGMQTGAFTGRKLGDYLTDATTNYVGARWVINGQDKAREIAAEAVEYEKALRLGKWE